MKPISPVQAIRKNCIECMGDQAVEVPLCHILGCYLWPYRLGTKPSNQVYHRRVKDAWERRDEQREYAESLGHTLATYLPKPIHKRPGLRFPRKPKKPIPPAG